MKKQIVALCMCMCLLSVDIAGCGNQDNKKINEKSEATVVPEVTKEPADGKTDINCWGDSLTAGTAFSNQVSYPSALQKLVAGQYTVNNFGIGGESSATIAGRMGALPLTVGQTSDQKQSFMIPEDTEKSTPFSILGTSGEMAGILRQVQEDTKEDCVNPVIINGVEGNIQRNGGFYEFVRARKGEKLQVSSGDTIIPVAARGNYSDDINIIWAGTNDRTSLENVDEVIGTIQKMIDYLESDQYIVIGLTALTYMPEVEEVNLRLAEAFGEHFYDFRTYVLERGLKDAGIKATKQDKKDLKEGDIPTSFIKAPEYDHVHGNEKFYQLLADQLYKKLQKMKYIG